jgi:negative regulator of sigma E activity
MPFTVTEANEQVITKAWPEPGVLAGVLPPVTYSRPVTTILQYTQCGPDQWRGEVLSTDGDQGGAGMIQARNGETGWSYVPTKQRLEIRTFPAQDVGAINWLALILNNYATEAVRQDAVAGAKAWYVELRPKYAGRPTMRLWVDQETSLLLRKELWGPEGRLLKVTQALSRPIPIRPGDYSPLVAPQVPGVSPVKWDQEYRLSQSAIEKAVGFHLAQMPDLPPGFVLIGTYLSIAPDTVGSSARWEFTDGIATINIVQSRSDGPTISGDVQDHTEVVRRGRFEFLIAGNVSRSILRQIASGMAVPAR